MLYVYPGNEFDGAYQRMVRWDKHWGACDWTLMPQRDWICTNMVRNIGSRMAEIQPLNHRYITNLKQGHWFQTSDEKKIFHRPKSPQVGSSDSTQMSVPQPSCSKLELQLEDDDLVISCTPSHHPFLEFSRWIVHEINHPAFLGYSHF